MDYFHEILRVRILSFSSCSSIELNSVHSRAVPVLVSKSQVTLCCHARSKLHFLFIPICVHTLMRPAATASLNPYASWTPVDVKFFETFFLNENLNFHTRNLTSHKKMSGKLGQSHTRAKVL